MRRSRGFSLVEALVTGLLFLFVVQIVGGLILQYSRASNHLAGRDPALDLLDALTRAQGEIESAIQLVNPSSPDTPSDSLEFTRIDATTDRFPATRPTGWDVHLPQYLKTVRLYRFNNQLIREVERADGTSTQEVLAEQVERFTVEWSGRRVKLKALLENGDGRELEVSSILRVDP